MERLFFYGTLRTGNPENVMLSGSRFVGESTVKGTLYHLGAYPALLLEGNGTVHGEVWECTSETVERLDSYEGVAEGLFDRVLVEPEGQAECWVYVAGRKITPDLTGARVLESGRWGDDARPSRVWNSPTDGA